VLANKAAGENTYKLIVFDVEEHQLGPEMSLLSGFDDLNSIQ